MVGANEGLHEHMGKKGQESLPERMYSIMLRVSGAKA